MSDQGWTRYVGQQEKAEEMKCEIMRRSVGLIVSDDIDNYDCTCCELRDKCWRIILMLE